MQENMEIHAQLVGMLEDNLPLIAFRAVEAGELLVRNVWEYIPIAALDIHCQE